MSKPVQPAAVAAKSRPQGSTPTSVSSEKPSISVDAEPAPAPSVSLDARLKLLLLAAAVRLLIFYFWPGLSDMLARRAEIATPINSFRRLQEGLFLFKHGGSDDALYDGGLYHQSPLFIAIFSGFPSISEWALPTDLVFVLLDVLAGNALMDIAILQHPTLTDRVRSPRAGQGWSPLTIAACFLFNPLTIFACLGRSTSGFTNLPILLAISSALKGNIFVVSLFLALASFISLYPVLLIPPILYISVQSYSARRPGASTKFLSLVQVAATAFYFGVFCLLGTLVTGSTSFLTSSYGFLLSFPDLNPNIGLWWYFLTEMFDSFREFFVAAFWVHMVLYVGGLTIRFKRQPLFAVVAMLGILASFLPYPSISDTSLFLGCLGLYSHVFSLMRYPFVACSVFLYCCFLGPTFYHLWIYAGSGNANFFYAITLVWAFGHTLLLGDSIYSTIKDEFEADHPELVGKDVQLQ